MAKTNLKYTVVYLRQKELKELKEIKKVMEDDFKIRLSVSALIRSAVKDFLDTTKPDNISIKSYLEYEGYI